MLKSAVKTWRKRLDHLDVRPDQNAMPEFQSSILIPLLSRIAGQELKILSLPSRYTRRKL